MKTTRLLATLLLCAGLTPLLAQDATEAEIHKRDKPAGAAELAAIAERGRAIAAYDKAAWYATDVIEAAHPPKDTVQMYLGQHTPQGWVIAFGKLSPAKDAFLMIGKTTPTDDYKHPRLEIETPASEERGQWLHEALAFNLARQQLAGRKLSGPYNGATLPAENGEWFVYFYPAQTDMKVFPTGADVRYRISADGTRLLETHRMHVSLLQNQIEQVAKDKTAMTFHTAVLDDAPEDTDVADVLMMGGIPMLIAGHNFVYQIAADGTPTYVTPTQVFLKDAQKK